MSVVRLPVSGEQWRAFKNVTKGHNLGISIQSFKHFTLQQVATCIVQTVLECSKALCVLDERYSCVSNSSFCYERNLKESKSALSSLSLEEFSRDPSHADSGG